MLNNAFFKAYDPALSELDNFTLPVGWWSRPREYAWARQFTGANLTVSDMGTGWTYRPFRYEMARTCDTVYAVDSDSRVLDQKGADNLKFIVADFAEPLPNWIKPASLDRVFCISVLEDCGDMVAQALVQFANLIKPDGLIVITCDAPYDPSKPTSQYPGLDIDTFLIDVFNAGLEFVGLIDFDKTDAISNPDYNLCVFHCLLKKAGASPSLTAEARDYAASILSWVKSQELPTGGIAGWPGAQAYPEVTGYLIPTLFDYGERELALRLADWLLTIQRPDGSIGGMNGTAYSGSVYNFDTGAVMEGLERAYAETNTPDDYGDAVDHARSWLKAQINNDGVMQGCPGSPATRIYTLRVDGLLFRGEAWNYWKHNVPVRERAHYLAYAAEGLLSMGMGDQAGDMVTNMLRHLRPDGLMPYWINQNSADEFFDVCATAQVACIMLRLKMDASRLVAAVRACVQPDGGVYDRHQQRALSWAAKFALDMERLIQERN